MPGPTRVARAPMLALVLLLAPAAVGQEAAPGPTPAPAVDASTVRGKVMCGYQGWFRTPGDPSGEGYVHWGRDPKRLDPRSLSVEMWPDLAGFPPAERREAPGFTHPDGRPAALFSSDDAATVRRHFGWMQRHGIDGAWLQHFVVDCPGGPMAGRFASRLRVLDHVRAAAAATGRTWALTLDLSGLPTDRAVDLMEREWRRLVASGVTADPRYLHEGGRPVVEVFGFYHGGADDRMSVATARRVVDFFHEPGAPHAAFVIGSGAWDWRQATDPEWQAALARLDGISPWNVGNTSRDRDGTRHATMNYWREDLAEAHRRNQLWLPVVYPGFGWDNLKRLPSGRSTIPRRGGRFLWEQFVALADLKVDTAFVAMFDEVDEGTAIFPVRNDPPAQAHFLTYEGLPTDWYLRLTGEGARLLRGERPPSAEIPIRP